MRRLGAAYTRATRDRVTCTVGVIGEAGLGKTRLIQEFAGNHGREARALTGRCLPYGEGITFWPLREVVRQAAGGDSPERIKALLAGEADAAAVADQLHRALGPGTRGRTGAAEIFWAARRVPGNARAAPPGACRVRGPALGGTDLPRPGGIARPSAGWLADTAGLHRPPGAARPAPRLGDRNGQGGLPPAHTAWRGPGHGAARLGISGSAHCPVHPGPAHRHRWRQSPLPGATDGLPQRAERQRHPAGVAAYDSGPAVGASAAPWAGRQQRPCPGCHRRQGLR